jgi:Skp family chaperone for outer membrane proteins
MKTSKLLTLFFLTITFFSIAQPRLKEKKEQIKALKIAYITEELQLTSEEASKFWPLFNAYEDKQESCVKKNCDRI